MTDSSLLFTGTFEFPRTDIKKAEDEKQEMGWEKKMGRKMKQPETGENLQLLY